MASKPPPPSPTVSGIVSLLRQAPSRGRGRRSPVMIWMQQNRKELEAAFAQDAPAWTVIASYLAAHGVMNGDGKPPTPAAARSAWVRVKAEAEAKAPRVPVAQEAEPVKTVAPAPPAPGVLQDDPALPQPAHERFKMASLRNHTPAASPPDPPPPVPTVPRQDSKAVIAALLGRGARPGGFRKPEPKDE